MITARQPQTANAIGLTLRDWFAAQALDGMLSSNAWVDVQLPDIATNAYRLADAMMAERNEVTKSGR